MEAFSKIAGSWLPFYSLHALETSLFVLAVFALTALVKRDIRLCYSLYVLAVLKIFVPPFFAAPEHLPAMVAAPGILQAVTAGSAAQSAPAISVPTVLFALWCLSVAVLLGFIFLQNLRLRRRLHTAVPVTFHANSALFRLLPFELEVLASPAVRTPLLLGIFRPKLYLPESSKKLGERELHSIVAHELGHYASRDLWILPLQTVALVLFWWNPLMWILHRKLLYFRELRCDEIAIAQTGIAPVEYSKLLYHFLEQQQIARQLVPAGAYFAHNKKNIFNRLQHVLEMGEKTKTAHRFLKLTVFALAAAIFIPLSLGWRTASLPSMQSSDSQTAHSAFVAYDSAPEPVGGFAALQKEVVYPEIARKAGIEGRVIANVLVSADGSVAEVKILKSLGHNGCDQAAIAAVKAVKWQPARYKSEPVSVWVGIPIIFKLPE